MDTLSAFDLIRVLAFGTFGIGVGFMVLTNIMAFMVLRPPQKLGFLWWHVTAISISFLCLGTVAVDIVAGKLGDPPNWRSGVTLVGTTLFMVAQMIIFTVERARLVGRHAEQVVTARDR